MRRFCTPLDNPLRCKLATSPSGCAEKSVPPVYISTMATTTVCNLTLCMRLQGPKPPVYCLFLPPVNEVWDKVIFSQMFGCLPGPMFLLVASLCLVTCSFEGSPSRCSLSKGSLWKGASVKGVSVKGDRDSPLPATEVCGTHPIGMHSCFKNYFLKFCTSSTVIVSAIWNRIEYDNSQTVVHTKYPWS